MMAQMTPADLEARQRALDPATSFIVQAPAGSGKTELLIQRYLRLLSVVDAPEEVVAITFTRKAAAEMRARVVKALQRCAMPSIETTSAQASLFGAAAATAVKPLEPHEELTHHLAQAALERDRQADWGLLENPARMRIGTIDALSAAITRRMPWTARFGAFPQIEERAEPMYREAARKTLLHQALSPDAPASVLLLHLDNDAARAENLIAQMLARRDQWLRLIGRGDIDLARGAAEAGGIARAHCGRAPRATGGLVSPGSAGRSRRSRLLRLPTGRSRAGRGFPGRRPRTLGRARRFSAHLRRKECA